MQHSKAVEQLCDALLQTLVVRTVSEVVGVCLMCGSLLSQPLQTKLNDSSEAVRQASTEVAELEEAAALARAQETVATEDEHLFIEPVETLPTDVSTDMLIDTAVPSHDTSCDTSCDSFHNPSLSAAADILLPEKLESPLTNHKPESEPSPQYLSQELF